MNLIAFLRQHECRFLSTLAFVLPISLLIPDFSLWTWVPKLYVVRYHAVDWVVSWPMMNALLLGCVMLLLWLVLEFRKRRMDELLQSVFEMTAETEEIVKKNQEDQKEIIANCVELIDTSLEHHDQLVLLQDEWRNVKNNSQIRVREIHHGPPTIEDSATNFS